MGDNAPWVKFRLPEDLTNNPGPAAMKLDPGPPYSGFARAHADQPDSADNGGFPVDAQEAPSARTLLNILYLKPYRFRLRRAKTGKKRKGRPTGRMPSLDRRPVGGALGDHNTASREY